MPLASTLAMVAAVGDLGDRAADRGALFVAGEQQSWGPLPLLLPVAAVFCLLPLPPPLQLLLLPPLLLPAGEVRAERRRAEGFAEVWLVLPPPWLASSMPTSTSRDCWDSSPPPVRLFPEFPRVIWAPRTLLPLPLPLAAAAAAIDDGALERFMCPQTYGAGMAASSRFLSKSSLENDYPERVHCTRSCGMSTRKRLQILAGWRTTVFDCLDKTVGLSSFGSWRCHRRTIIFSNNNYNFTSNVVFLCLLGEMARHSVYMRWANRVDNDMGRPTPV